MKLKTALITGASSGIGAAFAEALAADGMDLILVARSEDKLRVLAKQLHEVHSRRVEVVTADLGAAGSAAKVRTAADALGMPIDLLINNAGFGTAGAIVSQDAERERQEVLLNAAAVVDMTHAFLPAMVERRRGGIINVASVAAFQPLPYMAVYAATKAFVLSFSQAVRGEVRNKGVKVLALCPGPVDTPFFEATGNAKLRGSVPKATLMSAEAVVKAALRAFRAGRSVVVPGIANRLLTSSVRFMPRDVLSAMTALVMKR
ncbi:MAG: SDR family NAD(P)-dependent oxidoreductase [Gammaproteobacteria bacterium]